MKLIDIDTLHIKLNGVRMNGKTEFANAVEKLLALAPVVEAVPVEFIECEKNRINLEVISAVEHGDMEMANKLTLVISILESLRFNWLYTYGSIWRSVKEEERKNDQRK